MSQLTDKPNYKFLIIEDDFDVVHRFRHALDTGLSDDFHYLLQNERSLAEGLDIIEHFNPNLVFLSYTLPDSSGIQTLETINSSYPNLPIVLLMDDMHDPISSYAIKAGAADCINKEVLHTPTLHSVIHQILDTDNPGRQSDLLGRQHTLLIVDDSPDDRELIRRRLNKVKDLKFDYIEAGSGDEAFSKLEQQVPDCMLLDYSMPGHDGLEVLKRAVLSYPFLAVILLTGQGNEEVATQAIKMGAQHYLVKSNLTPEVLDNVIRAAISHKAMQQRLALRDQYIHHYEQTEAEWRERLDLVVNSTEVVIWDCDFTAHTIKLSKRFHDILGYRLSNDEMSLKSFINLIHEDDRQSDSHTFFTAQLKSDGRYEHTVRMRSHEGEWKWIQFRGRVLTSDNNQCLLRAVGILQDVTLEKNAQEQIIRANQELERFAYVSSHDMQEPLRMVVSFSSLLEQRIGDQLDDKGKEYLHFVTNGAKRMQALIKDLLEYSKLTSQNDTWQTIDLNEVVEIAMNNLALSVSDAGAKIDIGELPQVIGNPARLTSVFQNILSNAIKYRSDARPLQISIQSELHGDFCTIYIRDNGIGFNEAYSHKIFEPFQRLHRKEEYPGTGIGLAICRKIITDLGGQIWVSSKIDEGTCFNISFPVTVNHQQKRYAN
jgi:PAS domain S-box-containing protein